MSGKPKPDTIHAKKLYCIGKRPYENLATAILTQAVQDWRLASEAKYTGVCANSSFGSSGVNLEEIEEFFLSQWCEDLLSKTNLNGDWILRKLKAENAKRWPNGVATRPEAPRSTSQQSKRAEATLAKYRAMREMWAQGYSDTAIAGAFGSTKHTVECWRHKQYLSSNGPGIADKLTAEEVEQRRRLP